MTRNKGLGILTQERLQYMYDSSFERFAKTVDRGCLACLDPSFILHCPMFLGGERPFQDTAA